ncbi:MAG: SUMF1/EgtB/PvdO family nonheme iron enzyme [Myxococcales bacterium]|nr:SUMF1/EgtB/PvdO family nonheme iron enzyme [Myxococcales bacterium]MCB9521671.1 SUMF1/EgtB/PvdO family nonheme iron enzyme [Myxococcales bacterium]MCB9533945.1 SUMF1/EgtB/PvdO family nonheme iron enzyme [Myxococcales bacterium]
MFEAGDKFDKYTIVRRLGSGGMGDVYLARNAFGADVVLKALHPDLASNADVVERFHREGRIQYTLRHPHIVRVTDIVETDGRYALVVDFMRGRDLEARLHANGPLSVEEAVKVSTKMLDALQTAHDHGYIHRDLKPANIFLEEVDGGWEPRLMDFGIAKIQEAGALTRAQEFCGTPCYASPEQIASTKDVDARTDVYSFGVVLWSMFTGVEPFADRIDDPYKVLAAVVREPLPALPSTVPGWMREIIAGATRKDVSKRYQSAAEFRDALIAGARANAMAQTVVDFPPVAITQRAFASTDTAAVVEPPPRAADSAPPDSAPQPTRPAAASSGQSSGPARPAPAATPRTGPLAELSATEFGHQSELFERNAPVERQAVSTPSRKPTAAELARARAVEASFRGGERRPAWKKLLIGLVALAAIGGGAWGARWAFARFTGPSGRAPEGFVRVEAGTFTMGSPTSETGRGRDERQVEVTITRPFAIQIEEVTQAQWAAAMYGTPDHFEACGPDCPMVDVTWTEAVRYANRLSVLEGLETCYSVTADGVEWPRGLDCVGYRLPTEAEWEYAARAGSTSAFPNGGLENTGRSTLDPRLTLVGWYGGNSHVDYAGGIDCSTATSQTDKCGPQPARSRRANAWGLFDTAGNVAEWVWDRYGAYPDGAVTDPTGPQSGDQRVIRGGSWRDTAERCRSAARDKNVDAKRMFIGLRVARTLR